MPVSASPKFIADVPDEDYSWSVRGRRLFWIDGNSLTGRTPLGSLRHPVCLVATQDARTAASMSRALMCLLKSGASYLCFHASNATALHREADFAIISMRDKRGRDLDAQRGVICTVGEDDTSLSESAWYFINAARPTRRRRHDFLMATWGDDAFAKRVIRAVLKNSPRRD